MQIIDFTPLILLGPFALLLIIGLIQEIKHGNIDKRQCEKHIGLIQEIKYENMDKWHYEKHNKTVSGDAKPYSENKDAD